MSKFVVNEEFLQQVEVLQMLLKNNVAGMFGGNHRSKTYGSSCEFADYRDYIEGDDTTKIDWNAYARFDKLYLKLYLDERQMHTRIYIDASRSMEYGDSKKAEQALKIAAFFAYLSVCETDKVSIYIIRDKEIQEIVAGMVGKESYLAEIGKLNQIEFGGDSYFSEAIAPENVGYGDGMSIIISDFLTDNNYENAIDQLCGKKRDVLCVQVLAKEEINPLTRGKVHFFDSEDSNRFYRKDIDKEIVKAYKLALAYVSDRLKNYCMARGAMSMLVSAEDSLSEIVFDKMINMEVLK